MELTNFHPKRRFRMNKIRELKAKEKELQQQLNDHQVALNEACMVAETDLAGKIIYANDKFCEVSGYDRTELLGNTHQIVNSNYHSSEFFKNLWTTISSGKVWRGEIRNKAKNGSFYWVDTTIVPFRYIDGKVYKYVAIRHDITKAKELENELRAQVVLAEQAINSSILKTRFIAELSHEIRSGLNSIMGFSELLEGTNLETKQRHYLSYIRKSSDHVLALMNDVLEASKLDSSKIEIDKSEFPLKSKVLDIIGMKRKEAEEKGLEISLDFSESIPNSVVGDAYRLSQILINLLSNAIKFTEKGKIIIKVENKNESVLKFSVIDSGRGIEKEKQGKLFREFSQCHPGDSKNGTGLGLAISKKLVELMGGTIYVESIPDKGSTFVFEIPNNLKIPNSETPTSNIEEDLGFH